MSKSKFSPLFAGGIIATLIAAVIIAGLLLRGEEGFSLPPLSLETKTPPAMPASLVGDVELAIHQCNEMQCEQGMETLTKAKHKLSEYSFDENFGESVSYLNFLIARCCYKDGKYEEALKYVELSYKQFNAPANVKMLVRVLTLLEREAKTLNMKDYYARKLAFYSAEQGKLN